MGSRYEVEVTIETAKNLKNVNWRNGQLKPYAVVWIDDGPKVTTKVDVDNDEDPIWDEKLLVPLPPSSRLEEAKLYIDVVHANAAEGVKPLVGSAKLHLHEVVDEVGIGGKAIKSLKLKRPSGRPHGKLEVKVAVKEPQRYYDQYAPPYGQAASRGYGEQYGGYGQPYAQPQPGYSYPATAPPAGYPYGGPPQPAYGYGAPPQPAYGSGSYGSGSYDSYGSGAYGAAPVQEEKKKGKLGMGAGLAIGAVGGVLGGLALAEGIDYVEDKIADDAAEKVEDDLAYGDDGGDDW
ncbi:Calcium-dependent lipid-binding (CaLB domain) family protein [Rhynchospora pubera]|uniref:Calcium-dependent lipid-binding (CaLB domain) family protein n=1 Tax=Rhynchospora pubera TaxID=906938 RepID=A0AAV8GA71_9POAL|nr:Calcium-dependent lipid-binding (CaLB domain) family protein [Rhynchospora pubera]